MTRSGWVRATLMPAASVLAVGCSSLALGLLNLPARFGDYRLVPDLSYGDGTRLALDVYVPRGGAAPRPVVVFFHGGRWSGGRKETYRFAADALTGRGYVAVVPTHRLYPEVRFPVFVQDGAEAVAWTRRHIAAYGGDPARIFLMGHSSGAHIAALLVLDADYLRAAGGSPDWIAGMIGLAGPYDFLPLGAPDLKDMFGPAERYPASQPITFARAEAPPLLLLHGKADETVYPRNSINLARAVRERGGDAEVKLYAGVGHSAILAALSRPLRGRAPVVDDVDRFIRDRVAAEGVTAP